MKMLAALASVAILLCASASFAKKAMDEEEMDLITAAGEPSVVTVSVTQDGVGNLESTTNSSNDLEMTATTADSTSTVDQGSGGSGAGAFEGEAVLGEGSGHAFAFNHAFDGTTNNSLTQAAGISISLEDIGIVLDASGAGQIGATQNTSGDGSTSSLTINSSASSSSTISAGSVTLNADGTDDGAYTLNIGDGSQTNLRALTVNNVVGENQVANGFNIASSIAQSTAPGSQANEVKQSWGSSYDWTYAPGFIESVSASADGGDGGTIEQHGNNACVFGPCNVANASDPKVETKQMGFDNTPLTINADKITKVDVNTQGDADVTASMTDNTVYTANLATNGQTSLAALVANNVVGRNQVASGINVVSAGATLVGQQSGTPQVAFGVIATGYLSTFQTTQKNTIVQFRGTPIK